MRACAWTRSAHTGLNQAAATDCMRHAVRPLDMPCPWGQSPCVVCLTHQNFLQTATAGARQIQIPRTMRPGRFWMWAERRKAQKSDTVNKASKQPCRSKVHRRDLQQAYTQMQHPTESVRATFAFETCVQRCNTCGAAGSCDRLCKMCHDHPYACSHSLTLDLAKAVSMALVALD